MFTVKFHQKAIKELSKLDKQVLRMVKKDVEEKLKVHPKEHGELLNSPLSNCYKLKYKSLNLRLVYTILDDLETKANNKNDGIVFILAIGERTRNKVYKDAESRK